jgi:hypothetical protein
MEDLNHLEQEVEAGLALLGRELDVPLPESTRQRVAAAVRIAIDEHWLAERADVAPSRGTLTHVRGEVRRELSRRSRLERIWRACSLGAAAAMVLLCIGLVQHATVLRRAATSAEVIAPGEMVELFVAAGDQVLQEDGSTAAMRADLGAIEEGIARLTPDHDEIDDGLNSIGDEAEKLFDSSDDADSPL